MCLRLTECCRFVNIKTFHSLCVCFYVKIREEIPEAGILRLCRHFLFSIFCSSAFLSLTILHNWPLWHTWIRICKVWLIGHNTSHIKQKLSHTLIAVKWQKKITTFPQMSCKQILRQMECAVLKIIISAKNFFKKKFNRYWSVREAGRCSVSTAEADCWGFKRLYLS